MRPISLGFAIVLLSACLESQSGARLSERAMACEYMAACGWIGASERATCETANYYRPLVNLDSLSMSIDGTCYSTADAIAAGRLAHDQAALVECEAALTNPSCRDPGLGSCARVYVPQVERDGECMHSVECIDGVCLDDAGRPSYGSVGTCTERPGGLGGLGGLGGFGVFPTDAGECDEDEVWVGEGCVPMVAEGEVCTADACVDRMPCVGLSLSSAGVCQRWGDVGSACVPGFYSGCPRSQSCVEGRCVARAEDVTSCP